MNIFCIVSVIQFQNEVVCKEFFKKCIFKKELKERTRPFQKYALIFLSKGPDFWYKNFLNCNFIEFLFPGIVPVFFEKSKKK